MLPKKISKISKPRILCVCVEHSNAVPFSKSVIQLSYLSLTYPNDGELFFVWSGIHTGLFTDLEIPNMLLSLNLICHPKEWLYLFL